MTLLIENIILVDALGVRDGKILIENDRIKKIMSPETKVKEKIDRVLDGGGKVLMPGFIDMHCHLRDPGRTQKEDFNTGLHAAVKGGFTTVCAMGNTLPVMDDPNLLDETVRRANAMDLAEVIQVCAVTKGFGEEPADYEKCRKLTPIFSNDGSNIDNDDVMRKALQGSKKYDFILATHCEPETPIVTRDVALLKQNKGGHLHVCHISQKLTLDAILRGKKAKLDVTCEVTPHHLYASGLDYRVHPPFRTEEDRQALIQGVKDGSIDICGTDHAPHTTEDKAAGAPGINNFETAFGMYYTVFNRENIPLTRLSAMMSVNPAKRLGLKTGLLKEKYPADLVLVDIDEGFVIDPETFVSKSKNTPFAGEKMDGRVIMTMKKGRIVFLEKGIELQSGGDSK